MTREEILVDLGAKKITAEEAGKLLDEIDAAKTAKSLGCKPTRKGCICVTGLRRMGVSFYPKEWKVLLEYGPTILEYLEKHLGKEMSGSDRDGDFKATLSMEKAK